MYTLVNSELNNIHQKTVTYLNSLNAFLTDTEDYFWYGGSFYSGSITPKILFVGFNPGYLKKEWPSRFLNPDNFLEYKGIEKIKYLEEYDENCRLATRIFKLIQEMFNYEEEKIKLFLQENTAETNLIHFASPYVQTLYKSMDSLPQKSKDELLEYFINNFKQVVRMVNPCIIVIIGLKTFNKISERIKFEPINVLVENKKHHPVCIKTAYTNDEMSKPIIVTKHLSMAISNENLQMIATEIKKCLNLNVPM